MKGRTHRYRETRKHVLTVREREMRLREEEDTETKITVTKHASNRNIKKGMTEGEERKL